MRFNTTPISGDVDSCNYYDNSDDPAYAASYSGCYRDISLGQGWNNVSMTINDTLDNKNSTIARIYVDSISPALSQYMYFYGVYSYGAANSNITLYTNLNNNSMMFNITDAHNATCYYYMSNSNANNGNNSNNTQAINNTLVLRDVLSIVEGANGVNGTYAFEADINHSEYWSIVCMDSFGNPSSMNGTIMFKNTAPSFVVIDPLAFSYMNKTNISLKTSVEQLSHLMLNMTNSSGSARIYYYNITNNITTYDTITNGTSTNGTYNVSNNNAGNMTVNITFNLTLGYFLNNLTIFLYDDYGNNVTTNYSFYVDNAIPAMTADYGSNSLLNSSPLNNSIIHSNPFNITINITENIPTMCTVNISDYENSSALYLINLSNASVFGFEFENIGVTSTNPNMTTILNSIGIATNSNNNSNNTNNTNTTYVVVNLNNILIDSLNHKSSVPLELSLNDSTYKYNITCEDYAGNFNRLDGRMAVDSATPRINAATLSSLGSISEYPSGTSGTSEINASLGETLQFYIQDYNITNARYYVRHINHDAYNDPNATGVVYETSNPSILNTTYSFVANPNAPYYALSFDTSVLDNEKTYLIDVNATDSNGNKTSRTYVLRLNTTTINLSSIYSTLPLPYGHVLTNSTFILNYTSVYNVTNVTVYITGTQNYTIQNSSIALISVQNVSGLLSYSSTFTRNISVAGNYSIKVYLRDSKGALLKQEPGDGVMNYSIYSGTHNATLFLTSPTNVINVVLYYGTLRYNITSGASNLVLPDVGMGMNITFNDSVSINIPQAYTNMSLASIYFKKITDFTNQSYYEPAAFSNYNIHEAYYITINNISNNYVMQFTLNNYTDYSRAAIFKAPFDDVNITYANSTIIIPNITVNMATMNVSSFSIFTVLEDTRTPPAIPGTGNSGGGGGGGGSGGGGGGGPIIVENKSTAVNTTKNQTTAINNTIKENESHPVNNSGQISAPVNAYKPNIFMQGLIHTIDIIKNNYPNILWACMFLAILALTAGYAAKSIKYNKYQRYTKEEKIKLATDKFELLSSLSGTHLHKTSKDAMKYALIKEKIEEYTTKDHDAADAEKDYDTTNKELEILNTDLDKMLKKYEK